MKTSNPISAPPRLRVSPSISCSTHPCSTLSPASGRRGISLTEVLLSMFVMTVGILGLAALIPVGGSDVATATRNDRSSNLGRAAFREVQIRDWLNPNMWLDSTGNVPALWLDSDYPDSSTGSGLRELPNSPLEFGNAFCIDPLFVTRNVADPNRSAVFPYSLDNDPDANANNALPNPPRMTRGTLRAWPSTTATWIQPSQAERLFRSSDDLIFGFPENEPDSRPFASLGSARQVRQFTGDYSWLITVAPLMNEFTMSTNATGAPQMYTVSVAVFQKRTLELSPIDLADRVNAPPTERTVYCDFISGVGLGGGDVRLGLPVDNNALNDTPNEPSLSDFPAVRPGQWIMLSGWQRTNGGSPVYLSPTFRWYRVIAAGPLKFELLTTSSGDTEFPAGIHAAPGRTRNEWAQYVTLAGPDWWASNGANQYIDVDNPPGPGGSPHTTHAAIIDGVVGVYEKTMRIDTRAFGVR